MLSDTEHVPGAHGFCGKEFVQIVESSYVLSTRCFVIFMLMCQCFTLIYIEGDSSLPQVDLVIDFSGYKGGVKHARRFYLIFLI